MLLQSFHKAKAIKNSLLKKNTKYFHISLKKNSFAINLLIFYKKSVFNHFENNLRKIF